MNLVNSTHIKILEQYQHMAPLNTESRSYTLATDREKLMTGIFNRRFVSDVRSVDASRLYTDGWQVWGTKKCGLDLRYNVCTSLAEQGNILKTSTRVIRQHIMLKLSSDVHCLCTYTRITVASNFKV